MSSSFHFLTNRPYFLSSIWIVHVLRFYLRCITPLKLKILKLLNFSTIISIEIFSPLATKLRDLKMFKMAFQVVFSAKNVPRFSFRLLVAPKPKKQGWGHNGPPPPRVTTSFQSPGRIGLRNWYLLRKNEWEKCPIIDIWTN